MPRHLLPAFCLSLLLLGCACGPAYAADGALRASSVPLFAAGRTKVPAIVGDTNVGGSGPGNDVGSFDSPFLAAGGGVMVALAEARYTGSYDAGVDIVARYTDTEGANWAGNTTEHDGNNWRTQLILQRKEGTSHYALQVPTAVVKDNKIYLLALHNGGPNGPRSSGPWYLELAVGEISSGGADKTIEWNASESLHSNLTGEVGRRGLSVYLGFGRSALLTRNGTIVFCVNAQNRGGEQGFAVMQLKDGEEHWEVSFVTNSNKCLFASFLEWKGKLIMILTDCFSDVHDMKEYDEVKKGWKDLSWALPPLRDIRNEIKDFTPLTIGNKTVLLFTERYRIGPIISGQWRIHLWITDGSRVHDVGPIVTHNDRIGAWGLLHTKGELFFLHRMVTGGTNPIVLTRLNHQLDGIKSVLGAWARNDARLSERCGATALRNGPPSADCLLPMPTGGLVGLLSNNGDDTLWHDEYLFMNATVRNAIKVANGYFFSGTTAGARWPVRQHRLGRQYSFGRHGFTLAATVIIRGIPSDNQRPLLTFNRVSKSERLGLWYGKDRQWKMSFGDNVTSLGLCWNVKKTYHVALVLRNNSLVAYVEGNRIGEVWEPSLAQGPFDIESFFIGGYGDHEYWDGVLTVSNVLLYNRPLNTADFKPLRRALATGLRRWGV